MKKLVLFFGLSMLFVSANAIAQSCSHGSKSAEAKSCVKPSEAAMKAASMDASIETKVCEKSGSVCFLKKSTDASGNVSKSEVRYDEASAQFVALSTEADASAKSGKSCSSSKACCSKGAKAGKACCASKGTASTGQVAPSQNVKSE